MRRRLGSTTKSIPFPSFNVHLLQVLNSYLHSLKDTHQLDTILAPVITTGLFRNSSSSLKKIVSFLTLSCDPVLLIRAGFLLQLYADAHPFCSTFLFNNLIRSFASSRFPQHAITTFVQMLHSSRPDNYTFPFLLKASTSRKSLKEGVQIHGQIVRTGFPSEIYVVNTLLNMYCAMSEMASARMLFDISSIKDVVTWNTLLDGYVKSGSIDTARELFDEMTVKNEITWSTIISGYAKSGELDVALSLFDRMPSRENTIAWNSMISAFAKHGFLTLSRKLFNEIPTKTTASWNSMISGYVMNGELEAARELFDKVPQKDVFTWSCMISGYAQSERCQDALLLFKEMQIQNVIKPNEVTLLSVLSACAQLSALDEGKWVHAYINRNKMKLTDNLGAAMVDMYAKCGSIETAINIFRALEFKTTATWNALIMGLAINGMTLESLKIFAEMQETNFKPDDVTFVGVLTACSHGGLVDEGCQLFKSMSGVHNIQPELKHYGCMVDMYGRAGLLEEAEDVIRNMPMEPDTKILGALLGACRIYQNDQVADRVHESFLQYKSNQAGCHVLLSNIYIAAGRWVDSLKMREILKENRIKKNAGCSLYP